MNNTLKTIIDLINSQIDVLKENGLEIYDYENDTWFLNKIEYSAEDDKIFFKCRED